jgi:hypothetical protein
MRTSFTYFCSAFFLILFLSCDQYDTVQTGLTETVDREQILADVQYLASDKLEGRKTGTEGNRIAREYIEKRLTSLGLATFGDSYRHPFEHSHASTGTVFDDAENLIGYVEGSENPGRFIVITAHYDHLGIQNGEIYNGADDNASGTGGLMAAARYFTLHQPENSLMFIAFDAEEQGLGGARHFVENPVVPLEQIVLNVNMDMISTNFENEIYAVGAYHYPFLKPLIEESVRNASVDVLFGYDNPDAPDDWTLSSDHGPFHQNDIPFVYFGVEDHPHYHQPTDIFENINPDFYVNTVKTIIETISHLDRNLEKIAEDSGRF